MVSQFFNYYRCDRNRKIIQTKPTRHIFSYENAFKSSALDIVDTVLPNEDETLFYKYDQ